MRSFATFYSRMIYRIYELDEERQKKGPQLFTTSNKTIAKRVASLLNAQAEFISTGKMTLNSALYDHYLTMERIDAENNLNESHLAWHILDWELVLE